MPGSSRCREPAGTAPRSRRSPPTSPGRPSPEPRAPMLELSCGTPNSARPPHSMLPANSPTLNDGSSRASTPGCLAALTPSSRSVSAPSTSAVTRRCSTPGYSRPCSRLVGSPTRDCGASPAGRPSTRRSSDREHGLSSRTGRHAARWPTPADATGGRGGSSAYATPPARYAPPRTGRLRSCNGGPGTGSAERSVEWQARSLPTAAESCRRPSAWSCSTRSTLRSYSRGEQAARVRATEVADGGEHCQASFPAPAGCQGSLRVSVMVLSCGDAVQPAAEADQRASGAEDVPDAVQQPAPAAQRPRVGQVGDRLLHQRAQPRLQAVERPLLLGEAVFGAPV